MARETFKYAPGLEYDDPEHKYYYQGAALPGVTGTLEYVGLSDFSFVDNETLTRAMLFGTAVHSLTEFDDKGILGEYDPKLQPALTAWRNFKKDLRVEILPEYIELKVFNKAHRYAGTLDRIFMVDGTYWLIDIKTGGHVKSHAIQCAAYEAAFRNLFGYRKKIKRACVYIDGDKYKVKEHNGVGDWTMFQSALNIANYMRR